MSTETLHLVDAHLAEAIATIDAELAALERTTAELAALRARLVDVVPTTTPASPPPPVPVKPPTPPTPNSPRKPKPAPKSPSTAPKSTRSMTKSADMPWEEIALCYTTAVAEGRSPYAALTELAAQLGKSKSTAGNWPKKLRDLGLITAAGLPAAQTPAAKAEPPAAPPSSADPPPPAAPLDLDAGKVYRCDSCDEEFDALGEVHGHVVSMHGRQVRPAERLRVSPLSYPT